MRRQKKVRNIKYKDFINLDETLAKFILPRLKFFRKKKHLAVLMVLLLKSGKIFLIR